MTKEHLYVYSFVGSHNDVNAGMRSLLAKNLKPLRSWQIKLFAAMAKNEVVQFGEEFSIVLLPDILYETFSKDESVVWQYFYGGLIKLRATANWPQLIYGPGGFEFVSALQPVKYLGYWQQLSKRYNLTITFTKLHNKTQSCKSNDYALAIKCGAVANLNTVAALIDNYHNQNSEILAECVYEWLCFKLSGKRGLVAFSEHLREYLAEWCQLQRVKIDKKHKELFAIFIEEHILQNIANMLQLQPLSILKSFLGAETFQAFNLITEKEIIFRYKAEEDKLRQIQIKMLNRVQKLSKVKQHTCLGQFLSRHWLGCSIAKTNHLDSHGNSPLFYAIRNGSLQDVQALLDYKVLNTRNKQGLTPLMLASLYGRQQVVKY